MKVLIIKTSSMGDLIHTLPALTDAVTAIPEIKFDWVVESAFAEIPKWHKAVQDVIVVSLREWRKQLVKSCIRREIQQFISQIRAKRYDAIIDAQGLLKSAILSRFGCSNIYGGFAADSARELMASIFYNTRISVANELHIIERIRKLFAGILHYSIANSVIDYGVNWDNFVAVQTTKPYLFFLHGTTWPTKHWPEIYWQGLAKIAEQHGYDIYMTWATAEQKARAKHLANLVPSITVLPHFSITEIVSYLKGAAGIVAVDTGFSHLGSAIGVPMVTLYGPTDPNRVGTVSERQINLNSQFLCSPCFQRICKYTGATLVKPACFFDLTPQLVWEKLKGVM